MAMIEIILDKIPEGDETYHDVNSFLRKYRKLVDIVQAYCLFIEEFVGKESDFSSFDDDPDFHCLGELKKFVTLGRNARIEFPDDYSMLATALQKIDRDTNRMAYLAFGMRQLRDRGDRGRRCYEALQLRYLDLNYRCREDITDAVVEARLNCSYKEYKNLLMEGRDELQKIMFDNYLNISNNENQSVCKAYCEMLKGTSGDQILDAILELKRVIAEAIENSDKLPENNRVVQ